MKIYHPKFLVAGILILGILPGLTACMDSLSLDPASLTANISGNINTTDVTAAVALITNRSKTVDVTRVSITQNPNPGETSMLTDGISFENTPKRLTKKAKYLTPSDTAYYFEIWYNVYDNEASATPANGDTPVKYVDPETGADTIRVNLPLPKEIQEIILFRDIDGKVTVVVGPVQPPSMLPPNADPGDTGVAVNDDLVGEGSSPAIIPPENRNRMATFVVINRTNSQPIFNVEFEQGGRTYTMGGVHIRDKQSIALGQGTWKTKLRYVRVTDNSDLPEFTVDPSDPDYDTLYEAYYEKYYDADGFIVRQPGWNTIQLPNDRPYINSIIVPSNDPQAVKEHYLYFYLNNKGQYDVTEDWPPSNLNEKDLLPPDRGYGRGTIRLENKHKGSHVTHVEIRNQRHTNHNPHKISHDKFFPPGRVKHGDTSYVDVIGGPEDPADDPSANPDDPPPGGPIDDHDEYEVVVTVETDDGAKRTIHRRHHIKDAIVEIVIEEDDLADPLSGGDSGGGDSGSGGSSGGSGSGGGSGGGSINGTGKIYIAGYGYLEGATEGWRDAWYWNDGGNGPLVGFPPHRKTEETFDPADPLRITAPGSNYFRQGADVNGYNKNFTSIYVTGAGTASEKVYVAGYAPTETTTGSGTFVNRAGYWIHDKALDLNPADPADPPDPAKTVNPKWVPIQQLSAKGAAYATGLTVVNNKVYISGWYEGESWGNTAFWWSATAGMGTGSLTPLSNNGHSKNSRAYDIAFVSSSNDVYVTGVYDGKPCYWKNSIGNMRELSIPTGKNVANFRVTAIDVSTVKDRRIYISGYYATSVTTETTAYYWVGPDNSGNNKATGGSNNNNQFYSLDTSAASTSIFWNPVNNQVYISGYYQDETRQKACYWVGNQSGKIGSIIHLTSPATDANTYASSICVVNNVVYATGRYTDTLPPMASAPVYWVNGVPMTLNSSGFGQILGRGVDIFVAP